MKILLLSLFMLFPINFVYSDNLNKAYYLVDAFGVWKVIEKLSVESNSGYSGGSTNPTYKCYIWRHGHFEVVEIVYDKKIVHMKTLKNFG